MPAIFRHIIRWCLVALVLVTAPISIPLIIFGLCTETIFIPAEWMFKWRMWRKGRVLSQRQLLARMQTSRGTLILDSPTFSWSISHLWWTEDDVLSRTPSQPPRPDEERPFDRPFQWHPFDRWVWENYLDVERGRGLLVGVWHSRRLAKRMARRQADVPLVDSWSGGRHLEESDKRWTPEV